MVADYMIKKTKKSNINIKWIIYEIDFSNLNINVYEDPNYNNGVYIIDNINSNRIKIYDKE